MKDLKLVLLKNVFNFFDKIGSKSRRVELEKYEKSSLGNFYNYHFPPYDLESVL